MAPSGISRRRRTLQRGGLWTDRRRDSYRGFAEDTGFAFPRLVRRGLIAAAGNESGTGFSAGAPVTYIIIYLYIIIYG